ncbi:MAG: endonuclease/exonuclease/phosphatase family protein [Candidatus Solibacter usitatus]|nr:endonuclease/exonuclease/phosphatase family protein [Candidatus Solibacter usitatus]
MTRWILALAFSSFLCAQPQQVRVLTYNIHHGEGTDARIDLDRIAAVIRSAGPDVAAIQEVDVRNTRSSGVDQALELSKLTGMHVLFGKTINYRGGFYGNAVLSRWPMNGFVNHEMPFTPGREKRGIIESVPHAEFHFLATHLDTAEPDRLLAAGRLREIVVERPEGWPMIIAGDLNAAPGSATMNALLQDWTSAAMEEPLFTFPADKPTRQIDFVLFRPANRWRVIEARVLEESVASDHRPLLAVLELVAAEQPSARAKPLRPRP